MLLLHDALAGLAAHPRAVPWRLRLHAGWSGAAPTRDWHLFAPALGRSAWPILARVHNTILLANPAAAELEAPLPAADLDPWLTAVRSIHRVGIFLPGDPIRPLPRGDVPGVDAPETAPAGPGLAAGLDIGGTGMKACVLDGTVLRRVATAPTWPPGERGIDSLVQRARALLVEVAAGSPLGSLGIGLAAPMGVGGRVLELSTVLRDRVGSEDAFDGFAIRVATGLVDGPTTLFNDLSNLGRHLSSRGRRRMVRLQIGTSFGGCWIDTGGEVYATEMGRLVVDAGDDAIPHTYLPIRGTTRTSLSTLGVAMTIGRLTGRTPPTEQAGHALRALVEAGQGAEALDTIAEALVGAVHELTAILPGVQAVECGGSMLDGPAGRGVQARVATRVPIPFAVSAQPGHDGAIAAAWAPRVSAPLKGFRRTG